MSRVKKIWRVEVEWHDSQLHTNGWQPVRAHVRRRKRVVCHSIGFVLADDRKGIVLASSINGGNAAGVVTIPAAQIVRKSRVR